VPIITFTDCDFGKEKTDHVIDDRKANEILNKANERALIGGATQAARIGSLSGFFHEERPKSVKEWVGVLRRRIPNELDRAEQDIAKSLRKMERKAAILTGRKPPPLRVNRPYHPSIRIFVDDLTGLQTYKGKRCEVEILENIAVNNGEADYQPPNEEDESLNVDGRVSDFTYSVKPSSYLQKKLRENPNYSLEELGTDFVVEYDVSFNEDDCEVTLTYRIHEYSA